jgi:hypothetical protein
MKTGQTTLVLLLGMTLSGGTGMVAYAQGPPPPGAWEPVEPQGSWSQVWHSGFHDGVDAARHDIEAGRPPDPHRHDKFRHPDLPPDQRHDFREGFQRGYHMVYEHHEHGG